MPQVTVKKIKEDRIAVQFPYDQAILEAIKTIPSRQWDATHIYWLFQDTPAIREKIKKVFDGYQITNYNGLVPEKTQKPQSREPLEFERLRKELQSRKYSRNTIL